MSNQVAQADVHRTATVEPITSLGELKRYGITELPAQKAPPRPRRWWVPSGLVAVLVIAPIVIGFAYNFLVASERFVSTASFVVRKTQRGGLLQLEGVGGMTRSDDDSFAIAEFITSRDAGDWLERTERLPAIFADDSVDYFSRFPTALSGTTREEFYHHMQNYVSVDFNASTGISTLSVQAFSPADANRLATSLLEAAEALVNNLNSRAKSDAVVFADEILNEAKSRMAQAQGKMTDFRNTENLISPDSEVQISNLLITELLRNLGETDTQIAQMTATTPDNPKLPQLRLRREALVERIAAQRATMAGSNESLALKIEGYDRIRLERDLAEKSLINAVNAKDMAQRESQKGQLYLERVVSPSTPDRYGYPQRYWNMFLIALTSVSVFWIVRGTARMLAGAQR